VGRRSVPPGLVENYGALIVPSAGFAQVRGGVKQV
jgi:hypothetical protein